jgi:uncharacterized protein (DUF1800 family)
MRSKLIALVLTGSLAIPAALLIAADKKSQDKKINAASEQLDERQRAAHALNRLTFGPRPGEVDRVASMGVAKWIEQQLNPGKIDDRALDARLSGFRTLRMDSKELVQNFPPPQILKQIASGKRGLPRDEEKRAVYEAGVERYRNRQQKKQEKGAADTQAAAGDDAAQEMTPEEKQQRQQMRREARDRADELMGMDADARFKAILKMPAQERQTMVRGLGEQERTQLIDGMSAEQKETLLAMANATHVVVSELSQAKLLRAAYSERQLEEVISDFWFNHFNVFINKGADRYLVTEYEREVIRPHALGKFSDLLLATAKSPAMLFYLDNWQSVGPNSQAAKFGRGEIGAGGRRGRYARRRGIYQPTPQQQERIDKAKQRIPKGLNENYAREVMELHTLGVNGGYSQKDVTELARVLSGWSIERPREGGNFKFNDKMHDPGDKRVLGHTFKEHGEKEGEEALLMLARHPATAKFISRKLAMRFVTDDPPQALVDEMARTFEKSDGDIKEVLRTMFRSREFWAPTTYRAKVKTPLEFVVSAVRATGADIQNAQPLVRFLQQSGMQPYGAQSPTGYSTKADAWVNSGALLARLNFALGLGVGKLPGVTMDPQSLLGTRAPEDAPGVQGSLEDTLLAGEISKQTHDTIRKQMVDPQLTGVSLKTVPPGVIAGLILGSPEFQRR